MYAKQQPADSLELQHSSLQRKRVSIGFAIGFVAIIACPFQQSDDAGMLIYALSTSSSWFHILQQKCTNSTDYLHNMTLLIVHIWTGLDVSTARQLAP